MNVCISDYFTEHEITALTEEAHASEQQEALTRTAIDILSEKNLLNIFVPEKYGGLQLDLPDALPWLEATSWIDGSMGWTLTLTAGTGPFGAFMAPDFAQSIFNEEDPFIVGSGYPGGKAELTSSGYTINGSWKYASGINHATLITATCYITRDGKIQHNNGEPVTKAMAFYPHEVEIRETWNSFGLKATESHNFEVRDETIPEQRSFTLSPDASFIDGLLYQYPFEAFAHCTLAISLLGIVRRFFDESENILLSKNGVSDVRQLSEPLQQKFNNSYNNFCRAKDTLYRTVKQSWQKLQDSHHLSEENVDSVSIQSRQSCQAALSSAQDIYPLLGMSAIPPNSTINRCWRDMHTASQHMFLRPPI